MALHPNAMRVLRMIGVEDAVRRVAGHSDWQVTRNGKTGRVISKIEPRPAGRRLTGSAARPSTGPTCST